ncbi:Outer membrane protein transport protein (OMPP1/FadL/TodX) [Posidoniimonas polymericola]|uniref:Outer membrane protein transport protein (OMPP1/FadL/TodX) n=1 Tax=Posidoniimonas polymericola TaxID=2528002 RepID=A0A5C5YQC5_9BACT|nr:outer membrane protein transport protein [Posidoniimonas polymericola]TWT77131.1 Outer membrane protein transport protein (OMPP1/FadL/TodX) [Posidoniimonas polymericola]
MTSDRKQRWLACCVAAVACSVFVPAANAQGLIMPGVGTVNRGMSGVGTALPVDAAGAIFRNPATMTGLRRSEVTVGAELLLQTETLSSAFPAAGSGSTEAETGASLIPAVGLVERNCCSPLTLGFGMYGVAGFKANYPSSLTNPVLAPQPNGLGRVFAEFQVFEVAPAAALEVTPNLSVGFSPILAMGTLNAAPLFLAPPDDANTDTAFTYRDGLGTRYHYGGAFQLGVYYDSHCDWTVGASLKSPTWFEDFRFNTTDEVGAPRLDKLDVDLPMVASLGFGYTGIRHVAWGLDLRYFDYKNTKGFGTAGYNAFGAATGLGWDNVFSVSTAAQIQATERLILRMGYHYQSNPISDSTAFFNVGSPLVIGHIVSIGATMDVSAKTSFNIAYLHGFEGEASGPWTLPTFGAIPGSSVKSEVSADALSAGFTVRY